MSNSKFAVVKSRLEMELSNIDTLLDELRQRSLLEKSVSRKQALMDPFTLRAIGSILHDLYSCIESMFKIVARYIDESMPENSDWHIELLQQMVVPIHGVRPGFISKNTCDNVNEFRGFRHVFRHIYGFNLAAERIEQLLNILEDTIRYIKQDVAQFIQYMEEIL